MDYELILATISHYEEDTMTEQPEHNEPEEILVHRPRRAPSYKRFVLAGMVLGAVAALLILYFGPEASGYKEKDVLLVLFLYCVPIGGVLGAVLALIIDRQSVKKSR